MAQRTAIGARTQLAIGAETTFGTAASLTVRLSPHTGETLQNTITPLVSEAQRPDRAVHFRKLGTEAPGGDITFEQCAAGGSESFYAHGLGQVGCLNGCDGGVHGNVTAPLAAGAMTIRVATAMNNASFVTSGTGNLGVAWLDQSDDINIDYLQYTGGYNATTGVFTTITRDTTNGAGSADYTAANASGVGDWVFKRDVTNWADAVYTYVCLPARESPDRFITHAAIANPATIVTNRTSLTIEDIKDIVSVRFLGAKVNTISEDYPSNALPTMTAAILAREMWLGDTLASDASSGATSLTTSSTALSNLFPASSFLIGVGSDMELTCTSRTGTAFTLNASTPTTAAHYAGQPVYLMESMNGTLTASTVEPFSFVEAGIRVTDYQSVAALQTQQVLTLNWSVSNEMVDSKFVLGSSYRADIPEQDRTVTGSLSVQFDSLDLYNRYEQAGSVRLDVQCVSGDVIGTTTVPFQKHVIFPKIEFDGTTPTAPDKSLITMDLPFTALFDDTNGMSEVAVIFVNGTTTIT